MRVGVLTSLFPTPVKPFEGIFSERRYRALQERGHTVEIVHPLPFAPTVLGLGPARWKEFAQAPEREERAGLSIRRPRYLHLPKLAVGNARRFAAAGGRALREAGEHDAIVCDYAWPAAAAVPSGPRAAGWVVSGRGSDVLLVREHANLRDELARGLRSADGWCGVSADLVQAMDELAGRPGRGVLVPNGVDLDRFRPRDRAAARRGLQQPQDAPLVLVVGHLIERKDPLLAARAFAAGAPPEARLVFVGRGPLAEALERTLAELGLEKRAQLVGEAEADQLAEWYAAADVLLLTSHREGRPNVVLEALASGRPVIATPAGGTAELLTAHPELLAADHEPETIAAALAQVLASAPSEDELRGMVADLTWAASAERLESLLQQAAREAHDRQSGAPS